MIELPITRKGDYDLSDLTDHNGNCVKDPFNWQMNREIEFSKNAPFEKQKYWLGGRVATLESSKLMVKETFDFGKKTVAEFGCGAYGWLYNNLISKNGNWIQFDINRAIAENNKKYNERLFFARPTKVAVGNIYEMPFKNSSIDVIVGNSSWDSIYFFKESVMEMKKSLNPGGFFVHFQDLHPADKPLILTEAKKRLQGGLSPNVPCGFGLPRDEPIYLPGTDIKIGGTIIEEILSINSIDYGEVRLGTYLIKHLADLLEEEGFTIHSCEEKRKELLTKKKDFDKRLKRFGFKFNGEENYFLDGYGLSEMRYDPSIPKGYVKEWKSIDVLVAQKN